MDQFVTEYDSNRTVVDLNNNLNNVSVRSISSLKLKSIGKLTEVGHCGSKNG